MMFCCATHFECDGCIRYNGIFAGNVRLDHKGSGGNKYPKQGLADNVVEQAPDAPGQLYNLEADPGETKNLYYEHPEIVKELKALLEESKQNGRSRS
jgi:arylsulfatase A